MSALLVVAALCVIAVPVAVVAVVRASRAVVARPAGDHEPVRAVRRRTAAWRWAGVVTGAAAAALTVNAGALGQGLFLAAPVFGLCVLAGVLAGELTVRGPAGRTRRAAVTARRARDYLPTGLAAAVAAVTAALLALAGATTAAGSADGMGRAGRSLAARCSSATGESHGPWPGSFYTAPLVIIVLAGLIAAALTLRQVTRRPRPDASSAAVIADDELRHRAGYAVTAACGVLTTMPLIGLSVGAAGGLLGISCRPAWWTVAGWSLLGVTPALLALLCWCAMSLILPARPGPPQ